MRSKTITSASTRRNETGPSLIRQDQYEKDTRLFFPSDASARPSSGLQVVGHRGPTAVRCAVSRTSLIALEKPYLRRIQKKRNTAQHGKY